MTHKFGIEKVKILDDPERKKILDPEKILERIGLKKSMTFADIGCGTGYFSIPASKKVGKVFALDIQDGMLDILREKIRKERIGNIDAILSTESSFPLPDNFIDIVLMTNVFHEFEDRRAILEETRRILKRGGMLAVVDWKKEEMDIGPPVNERLDAEEVVELVEGAGFKEKLKGEAGQYNYLIIATA